MSLYDKASLTMTPSGVKNAKIYSNKPYGGNGDFTFARDSIATRVNSDGYIENVVVDEPRLNYSIVNGIVQDNPSLLLEPVRTNSFVQSNQFDTTWSLASGLTLTSGQSSALTGGVDAWKLESNGSSGFLALNQNVIVSGTNSFSLYAKAGTNNIISLRSLSGLDVRAQFDLSNGSLIGASNTTSTEIKFIKDNWYRITITFSASNSAFYIYPMLQGAADAGYIYIQNAQLELGSYPTSYIPTSGSIVPRAAETANDAGTSADFNDSEGVLFAEISALANDGTSRRISLSNGSTSQRVSLEVEENANDIQAIIVSGTSQVGMVVSLANVMLFNKIAFKYKENDFAIWANGFELDTDTNGITPTSLSELAFDDGNGGADFYGNTKELAVFKTALTDTELESLTSWTSFNAMATGQLYTIK